VARRHYLVTYDIADDRRRSRLFERMMAEGDHAQYSVFFCEMNRAEHAQLRADIRQIIHDRDDQVLLLDLGKATQPLGDGLEVMGSPYDPLTRTLVV